MIGLADSDLVRRTRLALQLASMPVLGSIAALIHVCSSLLVQEQSSDALSLDELRQVLDEKRPMGIAVFADPW